jgi:lysozyme family protein
MAAFEIAIAVALAQEGEYRNVATDHGGPTKYGISQLWLHDVVGVDMTAEQIQALTRDEAIAYYRRYWWTAHGYSAIADQDVATKLFSMAINMGHGQAVKLCQEALGYLGSTLEVDGQLGLQTLAAVNHADPFLLLVCLAGRQCAFYVNLVRGDRTQLREAKGWLVRALWPFLERNKT